MFEAAGVRGYIKVGHRVALTLGRWSLVRKPETLGEQTAACVAVVVERDPFWSTQQPHDLWLDMDSGFWVFYDVGTIGNDGGAVRLRVTGDPDVRAR